MKLHYNFTTGTFLKKGKLHYNFTTGTFLKKGKLHYNFTTGTFLRGQKDIILVFLLTLPTLIISAFAKVFITILGQAMLKSGYCSS
jgi:hypothetical protein